MSKVTAEVGVKISANEVAFKAALDRATSSISKFENRLKNTISVTGALSQALGAFSVYEISRQVINTTSEFQKLETVLGKTLGSSQLAAQSFEMITKFAQESPYQVQELTNVFVRWTNLGLTPSIEKMRMLSDVASSLGAGFEQTGEAFKDLMVGQTKRIEEIGISAQQSNGKIQLSFKGVNVEIEKNAEGVMKALKTYSSLQGVQGASAAVMETLGGKTSNLSDKWTLLMYSIGQSTEGPLYWAIETLGNLTTALGNIGSEMDLIIAKFSNLSFIPDFMSTEGMKGLDKSTIDYILKFGKTQRGKPFSEFFKDFEKGRSPQQMFESRKKWEEDFIDLLTKEGETVDDINRLWYAYMRDLQKRISYDKQMEAISKRQEESAKKSADSLKQQAIDEQKLSDQKKITDFFREKEIQRKEYLLQLNKYEQEDLKLSIEQNKRFNETLRERLTISNAGITADIMGMTKPETGKLQKPPGIEAYIAGLLDYKNASKEFKDTLKDQEQSIDSINKAFSRAAVNGLMAFGDGLREMNKEQISFGENILRAIAVFMEQFGAALMVIGSAKISAGLPGGKKDIITGAALIGASKVTQMAADNQRKLSSANSFSTSNYRNGNEIVVTGQLVGSGRDLVAVINNTQFDNSIRRGG